MSNKHQPFRDTTREGDDDVHTVSITVRHDDQGKSIHLAYTHERTSARTTEIWGGVVALQQLTNFFEVAGMPSTKSFVAQFECDPETKIPKARFTGPELEPIPTKQVAIPIISSAHGLQLREIARQAILAFKPGEPSAPKTSS